MKSNSIKQLEDKKYGKGTFNNNFKNSPIVR